MRVGFGRLWRPDMRGRPDRLRCPGATQEPRGPHGPPGGEAGAAQAEGRLPPLQGLGAQGGPARGVQGRPGGGRGPLLDAWLHDAAHCRIPEVVKVEKKVRRRRDDVLAAVGLGIGNGRVESPPTTRSRWRSGWATGSATWTTSYSCSCSGAPTSSRPAGAAGGMRPLSTNTNEGSMPMFAWKSGRRATRVARNQTCQDGRLPEGWL